MKPVESLPQLRIYTLELEDNMKQQRERQPIPSLGEVRLEASTYWLGKAGHGHGIAAGRFMGPFKIRR